jgi:alanyl-tRNA synthetase
MYGSKLGFNKPFFAQMVGPLVQEMGDAFPELKAKQALIESTITKEEELFHKTLSRGTELFRTTFEEVRSKQKTEGQTQNIFPGDIAFQLSDTYGFPYDLTELMAREQNWTVDKARFDELLAEQRKRSQEGRDIEVIRVVTTSDSDKLIRPTHFTGYDELQTASIIISCENATLITTETPFYAELGGQVGDTGYVEIEGKQVDVINTVKAEGQNGIFVHKLREPIPAQTGDRVTLYVDEKRRSRIEAHHTVTHILHWALREVLGHSVVQKGSYVGPDRLRFDFAYGSAMTSEQLEKVHALIYEKIGLDDRAERPFGDSVDSEEMLYAEVKGDPSILQLFGDKYGEKVRVVSIGDYSRELCGGTHLQWTGHAGYFRVLSESSISAGIRRIEAASGLALIDEVESQYGKLKEQHQQLLRKATENGLGECVEKMKLPELPSTSHSLENGIPIPDVERVGSWDAGWQGAKAHWQALVEAERVHKLTAETLTQAAKEQAKKQESDWQSRATAQVNEWLARDVVTTIGSTPFFAEQVVGATAAYLPVLADALKARWEGVAILAATEGEKVTLVALSTPNFAKKHHAGKIMQAIAPLVGGKGGGRPDFAQGGGNQPAGVGAAFAEAEARLRG